MTADPDAVGDVLILSRWQPHPGQPAGHRHDSTYVETFWLPVIGPSAFVVYRRFGTWLDAAGDDVVTVQLDSCPPLFGLGHHGTRQTFHKALARLTMFGLAAETSPPHRSPTGDVVGLQIRLDAPDLPRRYVERLPAQLRRLAVEPQL